jgi:hypothetical protein
VKNDEKGGARNIDWVAEWKERWEQNERHRSPEFWKQRAPSLVKHVSLVPTNRLPRMHIFGEKTDSTLLGTVFLEALGLALDPMKRELRPLPMVLA